MRNPGYLKFTSLIFIFALCLQFTLSAQPEMVLVEGGTFKMGSDSTPPDGISDEKPVHTVTVSTFYMGETEVTVGQYQKFMTAIGASESFAAPGFPSNPVVQLPSGISGGSADFPAA